jgi:ELWxxDGT repeat protein
MFTITEILKMQTALCFLLFYDDQNGIELWKSDGTEAGTVMVKDIYYGIYSSDDASAWRS